MKKTFFLFAIILIIPIYSQSNYHNFEITWTEQNPGVMVSLNSAASSFQTNAIWVCGNNGVVLKTSDQGNTWINAALNGIPSNINLMQIALYYDNIALTSGNIDGTAYIFRTSDGGQNWIQVFSQQNGHINGMYLSNYGHTFMQGNPVGGRWSLWKSTDLGFTWDSTGLYLPQNNNETGWNNSFYFQSSYNLDKIWFGTNNHRIYYTDNSGTNWYVQNFPEQNIYSINWIGIYEVAGGNDLFITSDGGNSWSRQNAPGSGIINAMTIPGIVVIMPGDIIPSTPWLYLRNDNKIYYTDNGGSEWKTKYQTQSGSYNYITSGLNCVWAVKNNGGITRGKIDVITGFYPNYPYSFKLEQNFPNPFNPKTKIPVTIYSAGRIKLDIYNSAGKFLMRVADDPILFLTYDDIIVNYTRYYEWDGTNYPSGVYFYTLQSGDHKDTKKMVLVK